jgi:hypothetical protein
MTNSKLTVKFRAKAKQSFAWAYGFYARKDQMKKHFILNEEIQPYSLETHLNEIEVFENTVCQLRHVNKFGEYYDHDVYYHAGYDYEIVSAMCELQQALMNGNGDDICEIVGNVIDEPHIFDRLTKVPNTGYAK